MQNSIEAVADRLVNDHGRKDAIALCEKCITDCPTDESDFWKEVFNYLNKI